MGEKCSERKRKKKKGKSLTFNSDNLKLIKDQDLTLWTGSEKFLVIESKSYGPKAYNNI